MRLIEGLIYRHYINQQIRCVTPSGWTTNVIEHYGKAWDMVQYYKGLKAFALLWILAFGLVWMDVNAVRFI